MVKERIVLDDEMDKCKELYDGLCNIMKAYDSLPILEEIHSNCCNRLLNTNNSCRRQTYFAKAFNDLIIEYVSKPAKELSDDGDEW